MAEERVLVVDGNADRGQETAARLSERLEAGRSAVTAPESALDALAEGSVDCVVLGEFYEAVAEAGVDVPTVLFSDAGTAAAATALDSTLDDYCPRDGEDGQYAVLARTVADAIAKRRQARAHERDVALYRTIVEAAGDAMYALDEEGYITMVNESHAELSGFEKGQLIGTHVAETMREEDVRRGTEVILDVLSDPERERGRFEFRGDGLYPGDEERFFEDILAPITDEDGEYAGSVGVIRDVTDRKHRERELQRQNERLDEFASVVAHDLRTPLGSALGRIELCKKRHDDEELDDAYRSLHRMERMIEDLLTLARQGKSVDELERVRFVDAVREAWPGVEGATLELEDTPDWTEADPDRLAQLLENLFRNAVEHGSTNRTDRDDAVERADPGVTVTVGELDDCDGFFVADDGPGIPPEDRQDVFEHGYTTDEEGTGFGLAIVNRIAGAHGWTLSLTESESGGTRFEVAAVASATESPQ
jgi:PAS domain S-box-containing protein